MTKESQQTPLAGRLSGVEIYPHHRLADLYQSDLYRAADEMEVVNSTLCGNTRSPFQVLRFVVPKPASVGMHYEVQTRIERPETTNLKVSKSSCSERPLNVPCPIGG